MSVTEDRGSETVRKRYNRLAGFYALFEGVAERSRLKKWRALLWSKVAAGDILEVGVGTGANFPYYPAGARVTAIDLSEGMLRRARDNSARQGIPVKLEQMDVQALRFADESFDTVVATLVFCTVPDPVRGLRQIKRVCRKGGRVLLLEHVRSSRRIPGFLMDALTPFGRWTFADNMNRRTAESVAAAGLAVERVTDLSDIFKLIEARKQ